MKNSGPTEIYFDAYRAKHAAVKLKSSTPVEGQLFTLSRATEKTRAPVFSPNLAPKHSRMGTAGSVRFMT